MLEILFGFPLEFFTREPDFSAAWLQCNPPPSRFILTKKLRKSQSFAQFFLYINNLQDVCCFQQADYMQVYPPSTGRLTPVTYVVAGDERKQMAVSSSPSLPYLSRGIIVLALAWKNSESNVSFVRGL